MDESQKYLAEQKKPDKRGHTGFSPPHLCQDTEQMKLICSNRN